MKFIKFFGEEYQVAKRGREFPGFWEEYNVEKWVRCSIIFRLFGKISSGDPFGSLSFRPPGSGSVSRHGSGNGSG